MEWFVRSNCAINGILVLTKREYFQWYFNLLSDTQWTTFSVNIQFHEWALNAKKISVSSWLFRPFCLVCLDQPICKLLVGIKWWAAKFEFLKHGQTINCTEPQGATVNIFCTSTAVLHSIGLIHYQTRAPCGEEKTHFSPCSNSSKMSRTRSAQRMSTSTTRNLTKSKWSVLACLGRAPYRWRLLSLSSMEVRRHYG